MDFSSRFSDSTLRLKSSKIRELFKMANVPGIISMAGGNPDSTGLPFEEIKRIIESWNYDTAKRALQYGTTKGYIPLLEEIADWMETRKKVSMRRQEVLITTGSQQALALISKLFINEGDVVLVELPSFIGAIAAFYSYMGKIEGVRIDDEGIVIGDLERTIENCNSMGRVVKFIYTIPNFNNPSGITLSRERREKLLDVARRYEIPIVEDDPYGDLFLEGNEEDYLPVKSLDTEQRVI